MLIQLIFPLSEADQAVLGQPESLATDFRSEKNNLRFLQLVTEIFDGTFQRLRVSGRLMAWLKQLTASLSDQRLDLMSFAMLSAR